MAKTSDTSMPSFDDFSLPSFNVPSVPVEDSIADSLPVNATSYELPELEYHLIPGASKFGKDILTDSRGFSYTIKQMKGTVLGVTNWRCTKCNLQRSTALQQFGKKATFSSQAKATTPVQQSQASPTAFSSRRKSSLQH